MTPHEFKVWFDGFLSGAISGTPNVEQWNELKRRIKLLDDDLEPCLSADPSVLKVSGPKVCGAVDQLSGPEHVKLWTAVSTE